MLPPVLLPHLLRPSFARLADKPAGDIWVVVQVGVRVEEEDMRTGARTHCCSAYLTFVAVAARTAGAQRRHASPLAAPQYNMPVHDMPCRAARDSDGMITVHTNAGPMQPLRALPRVVPTQRAHQAIHAEAEVRRQKPCSTKSLHRRGTWHAGSLPQQLAAAPGPKTPVARVLQGRRAERLAARQAVKASRERRAEQARMRLQPVTHRQGGQTLAPALEVRRVPLLTLNP